MRSPVVPVKFHAARRLVSSTVKVEAALRARRAPETSELSFSEVAAVFSTAEERYDYFHHYFHYRCPAFIREHRRYFQQAGRGFGEDAFHAMWWLLLVEHRPEQLLEIGVFRGQTLSLWSLVLSFLHQKHAVHGISPFDEHGDDVSIYPGGLDYQQDVEGTFRRFGLQRPHLVRALSTDGAAKEYIAEGRWDLVYVDGSHDEDVVRSDYVSASAALRPGGLLVFDDASLQTDYRPRRYAFAGHPGPSAVAAEAAGSGEMQEILAVGHNRIFRKEG